MNAFIVNINNVNQEQTLLFWDVCFWFSTFSQGCNFMMIVTRLQHYDYHYHGEKTTLVKMMTEELLDD